MITKLRIKNFKAFKNEQSIRIAPITLIYGPNSAGKSSIIQSLQLLNQSFLNLDAIRNLELAPKGADLDLGLPVNFMHRGNTKSPLVVSFCSTTNIGNTRTGKSQRILTTQDSIELEIKLEFKQEKIEDLYSPLKVQSAEYTIKNMEDQVYNFKFKKISDVENTFKFVNKSSISNAAKFFFKYNKERFDIIKSDMKLDIAESKREITVKTLEAEFKNLTFSNRAMFFEPNFFPTYLPHRDSSKEDRAFENSWGWNRLMSDLNSPIERTIRSCNHISGLRNKPQRFYPLTNTRGFVGRTGENMAGLLLKLSKGANKNQLNKWLKNLEIPYQISVAPIKDSLAGSLLIIKLKDLRNNVEVTPSDVGIGISQILPLLIQGLSEISKAPTNTRQLVADIKCVEQPELHLHPKLQANIADFFIDTVKKSKNLRWILETHSESLMLRLQKRIRSKEIDPSLVSVIYVNPTSGGCSEAYELRIDEEGDFIDEWPHGFFEESYKEKFVN